MRREYFHICSDCDQIVLESQFSEQHFDGNCPVCGDATQERIRD